MDKNNLPENYENDDDHEDEEPKIILRPLSTSDFSKAKNEVSPSVSENSRSVEELRRWNDMFGGGGKLTSTLTYFL